ncbi:Putative rmlC-like cupin domain superfamily, rmlC-like jelly roll protein [Septoria linicola]|uniref:RmlC-like cupin domain superfamily, rmlC-like jelly roll protein n=1 Tax=Septoria linicola TaxID=215465 RepID=A0A9Q9AT00_9PEZI|nr:putative rmlC-like cupin domain superfamily, rmlC-like jelly roll protein [Septoria linicola]USW50201.1 Putative rmlC-like cupin domain superfamily, rmlC-like jelly roll protein [Septoria linicola]
MDEVGYAFTHGSRITHGNGANIKKPFADINLTMHELSPSNNRGFRGQLGVIEFTTEYRLPRHIHMSADKSRLVDERIIILHGVALLEIAGEYYAVAPGSLVDTVGGVPHTFTACPAGVKLPDGSVSSGKFTMVYEYEEPTSFFPTVSTKVVKIPSEYEAWEGDLDVIKLPKMNAKKVVAKAHVTFNQEKCQLSLE